MELKCFIFTLLINLFEYKNSPFPHLLLFLLINKLLFLYFPLIFNSNLTFLKASKNNFFIYYYYFLHLSSFLKKYHFTCFLIHLFFYCFMIYLFYINSLKENRRRKYHMYLRLRHHIFFKRLLDFLILYYSFNHYLYCFFQKINCVLVLME